MSKSVLSFVKDRFGAMLSNCDSWGSAEAFEQQALLLLEVQEVARGGTQSTIIGKYLLLTCARFPDSVKCSLGSRVSFSVRDVALVASFFATLRQWADLESDLRKKLDAGDPHAEAELEALKSRFVLAR